MKPLLAPGYGHLASISWQRDAFRTGLISATTGFGTFVLRDLQCLWGKKCERFENTIGNFIFFPLSQANWSASLPVLPMSCWLFPTKACSVLNVQTGRSKSLRTKSLVHSINPLYKAGKKETFIFYWISVRDVCPFRVWQLPSPVIWITLFSVVLWLCGQRWGGGGDFLLTVCSSRSLVIAVLKIGTCNAAPPSSNLPVLFSPRQLKHCSCRLCPLTVYLPPSSSLSLCPREQRFSSSLSLSSPPLRFSH